jgi:preprotein translocase subunit YajC
VFATHIIAQEPKQPAEGTPQRPPGLFDNPLFLILPLFILFYFIMLRPRRREESERQAQIAALKKNDEVVTIGGIVGTVISVKDKEVVVESNNSKLRMLKSSIAQVLTREDKEKAKEEEAGNSDESKEKEG